MDFVAIDVETANADMASICQIGIAKFANGIIIDEWVSLIDPEDYFDPINIEVHGITADQVAGAPTFPQAVETIRKYMCQSICVCHTHFDRTSLSRAFKKYDIAQFEIQWLDSARVARRAWPEFAFKGYGLSNICDKLGITFKHHNALEDAKAAGKILLSAITESQLDLDGWQKRVKQPIFPDQCSTGSAITREGNPDGHLFGEVMVFTGALQIPRKEAADIAAKLGCNVATSINKKTTLLVVGDQDISRLGGKDKSSKHIKALELISQGIPIRIIKESDFIALAQYT